MPNESWTQCVVCLSSVCMSVVVRNACILAKPYVVERQRWCRWIWRRRVSIGCQ